MAERDRIFRERLVAVVADLHRSQANDRALQTLIGVFATRMVRQAGVSGWADLKQRADGPTYDSMLNLFTLQSAKMSKAGDTSGVRAMEILALSLIARNQPPADLLPGVDYLDGFIARCIELARSRNAQMIPASPPANGMT